MKERILIIHNHNAGFSNQVKFEKALLYLKEYYEIEIEEIGDMPKNSSAWDSYRIVVAAGGDGTVSTVAQNLVGSQQKLGILPLGTFNHFAKHIGVPLDPVEASKVLVGRNFMETDVGRINDRYFLNFVFFGLYTSIIEEREQLRDSRGMYKWTAHLRAVASAIA